MKKTSILVVLIFILFTINSAREIYSKDVELPDVSVINDEDLYANLEIFSEVINLIQQEYVDVQTPKDILYGALEGMLMSLDPYSQFLAPDSYQELKVETEGEFGGIGIVIAIKDGILTIISPLEDTPGFEAGLQAGDRIVKIDDVSTKNVTLIDAVKKLRGKPNSEVILTILREKEQRLLEFKILRDIIKIESVKEIKVVEENIGYVKILEFQENTLPDFRKALKKLTEDNIQGLILDLRNNPGGLLNIAVDVSSELLPEGKLIVYTKGRNEKQDMKFISKRGSFLEKPLIVLINKGSASGSEILAGAIQDNRRGLILGQASFGKASVQTIIPLKDGSAVRLTTAHYYTPNGSLIFETGIQPDIISDNTSQKRTTTKTEENLSVDELFDELEQGKEEGVKLNKKEKPRDPQLELAIDIMKGLIQYRNMLAGSQ